LKTYAEAGVDSGKIAEFKKIMREVGRKTMRFPEKRGVFLSQSITHAHGAIYEYRGNPSYLCVQTQEGLGKKNWIAEFMYRYRASGKTYHRGIGIDTALMAVNDCVAHGAMPVIFTDKIAAPRSDWYADLDRARDLALGFEEICRTVGMAMPQGESSVIRDEYAHPIFSGCVTGIVSPMRNLITRDRLEPGDAIVAAASRGLHANGSSLVLDVAATLKHDLLTEIPQTGCSLGDEALIPTRSYVALVEALLENKVHMHGIIPGTGDGLRKLAVHHIPFTYVIERSMKVPRIFLFMRACGVSLEECLTTFNWGMGYYLFVPKNEVEKTLAVGERAGYELAHIGFVEKGLRQVIYEPAGIILTPHGAGKEKTPAREKNVGKYPMFGYGIRTKLPDSIAPQVTFEE